MFRFSSCLHVFGVKKNHQDIHMIGLLCPVVSY